MSKNVLFDILVLLLIFCTLQILLGCTNEPVRQFNSEDMIDRSCYMRKGAELGYCIATRESLK